MNWAPILLSLQLATITTLVLFIVCLPLVYAMYRCKSKWVSVLETLTTLPLILPPSVLGFYLLLLFNPNSGSAAWLKNTFGVELLFSFSGLVIASLIYSLPFMVTPLLTGLRSLPLSYREAAATIGMSSFTIFRKIELPNIIAPIVSAITLSFAHTIGEFGVVLMIGGSIPEQTEVASIALFNEVEALNYHSAHYYAAVLLAISFSVLLIVNLLRHKTKITTF